MIKARNNYLLAEKDNLKTIMLLKFSRSSELKFIERSLNQKNIILQIILRIVLTKSRKHGKE